MASDDSRASKYNSSDTCYSDDEHNLQGVVKKTSKSIHQDRIARDLIRSRNHVDKRLLKLKKIDKHPSQSTDALYYLGIKDSLMKSLASNASKRESAKLLQPAR